MQDAETRGLLRKGHVDRQQAVRLLNRGLCEQNSVHYTQERSVKGDSECEHRDGAGSEPRMPPQQSHCVANVLSHFSPLSVWQSASWPLPHEQQRRVLIRYCTILPRQE